MSDASEKKHVIILGAGASATSGYPQANALRLLMMSEQKVHDAVLSRGDLTAEAKQALMPMFKGKSETVSQLFRDGGFATIDEFSNLAHKQFPDEIQDLKRRLRFALALHNPEDKFEDSDYYPFIQKLFRGGIFPLRDDVSILTFNYDSYLSFLLRRAIRVRYKAAGKEAVGMSFDSLATSGFSGRNLDKIENDTGMCLLHLHGMIAWPDREDNEAVVSFDDIFQNKAKERFTRLHLSSTPPVIFPWELMDGKGGFCSKETFCYPEITSIKGEPRGAYRGDKDVHDVFCAIWRRAQKEIASATKISFVGLSMHEFLTPAFDFLFRARVSGRPTKITVINKDLAKFPNWSEKKANPRSPAYKVRKLIDTVWAGHLPGLFQDGDGSFFLGETFSEFIENYMD